MIIHLFVILDQRAWNRKSRQYIGGHYCPLQKESGYWWGNIVKGFNNDDSIRKYRVLFKLCANILYQMKKNAKPTRNFVTLKIAWKSVTLICWLQLVFFILVQYEEQCNGGGWREVIHNVSLPAGKLSPASLPGLRGTGGGRKELQEPNPGWPPSISWHHKLYLEKGCLGVLKNPYLQYLWSSYLAKVFILPQPYAMQGRSRPQACWRQTAKDKEFLQKYQDLFGFDQFWWINLSVVVKI